MAMSGITAEAESLIARAYNRHRPLALEGHDCSPKAAEITIKELESLKAPMHYEPQDWVDRLALGVMRRLRVFTHMFFRERYGHHAVVLESISETPISSVYDDLISFAVQLWRRFLVAKVWHMKQC